MTWWDADGLTRNGLFFIFNCNLQLIRDFMCMFKGVKVSKKNKKKDGDFDGSCDRSHKSVKFSMFRV